LFLARRTITEGGHHSLGEMLLKTYRLLFSTPASVPLAALAGIVLICLSAPATAATVTHTNPNCSSFALSGTPPNQTLTCVTAGAGAPVCAPTASPASPAVGQSVTITANCSNGPIANGYVWTGAACAGLTGATCTVTKSRAMSVTYSVSASNASGAGSAAQITITWQ